MKVAATSLVGCLFLAGCQLEAPSEQDVYRCQEGIELHDLLQSVGVPPQPQGWGTGSAIEAMANRIFDGQSETVLSIPNAMDFVNSLCNQLQDQLASRCEVPAFWSGTHYCAARTKSRSADTTDSNGFYTRRPSEGRVALFATSLPDGRTELILTRTEWAD